MYEQAAALVLAGDLAAARALQEAVGQLLPLEPSGVAIIDIARGKRG